MKSNRVLALLAIVAAMALSTGCFVDLMKITLEWTADADLDLAILEPDGQIYVNPKAYENVPASANGSFSSDSSTAGKETYTLNPVNHENGEYYALVINYAAYPVNCRVEINKGLEATSHLYILTVPAFDPVNLNPGVSFVEDPATIKMLQRELPHKTK